MKRSSALAPLSRDHHQGLVVAQRLQRATEQSAGDARAAFLAYWVGHGREHFRSEEETLLPAYAGYGDAHHPLVLTILGDHVAIRQRADQLARRPQPKTAELHDLGALLAAHIRREERELFPLIEETMPAGELRALADTLSQPHLAP